MEKWCTIESDPGVFTALIDEFGVRNIQVEELCSLDYDASSHAGSVYGLIFMFKWTRDEGDERPVVDMPGLFFAKQTIHNACATQAILSILMNASDIDLGQPLTEFREFVMDFSADNKGIAIGNSDLIRKAHNSFSNSKYDDQDDFDDDLDSPKHKRGEAFHFIAYIPYQGYVYELDGLKPGPILLGEYEESDSHWLSSVLPLIRERVDVHSAPTEAEPEEFRYNLLAVTSDKRIDLSNQTSALLNQVESLPTDSDQLPELLSSLHTAEESLQEEEVIRRHWTEENERRRFDYTNLIVCLLSLLSEKGKLAGIASGAREKQAENRQSNNNNKKTTK